MKEAREQRELWVRALATKPDGLVYSMGPHGSRSELSLKKVSPGLHTCTTAQGARRCPSLANKLAKHKYTVALYLAGFGVDVPKPKELKDGLSVILGLQGGQGSEHDGAVASTVQLVHLTDTCSGRTGMGWV